MGKGSSTKKTGVKKRLQSYSSSADAVAAGGMGGTPEQIKGCLITFKYSVAAATGVQPGSKFALVQNDTKRLIMVSSGRNIGEYVGEHKDTVEGCIALGYIYQGEIVSISNGTAKCTVTGKGKA
jgi:hypothetical protein